MKLDSFYTSFKYAKLYLISVFLSRSADSTFSCNKTVNFEKLCLLTPV